MTNLWRGEARPALLFLAAWAVSTAYLAATGADWVFPIVSLLIFGVGLSAIAWWLTRRTDAPALPVENPGREAVGLLLYLVVYAVLFVGILFTTIKTAVPAGREQDLAMLGFKLLIHVVLPAALLLWLGGRIRPMWDSGIGRRGFWPTLLVIGGLLIGLVAIASPSLREIAALNLAPGAAAGWVAASLLWMSLEAGLSEEFLFRAGLQSRLQAWLATPAGAIALTSVIFALCHAPGLYLRGNAGTEGWSTDPLQVAAYTVAALAPISVLFGVLWLRTRSLLLVVLLHGSVDMLPNTAELVRSWT
jgi:uncharacterized protein